MERKIMQHETKQSMSTNVIEYLKKKAAPVPEIELLNRIYLIFNELLPHSVMMALKSSGLVVVKNGMWSLK